jgi:cation diffusion facilitator CzcD-associated flavoprotein CzcO
MILDWSKVFSPQHEILEYLKNVAKKYDVNKNIKFGHKVKSFRWDEQTSDWKVLVESEGKESTHVFNIM